MSTLSAAIAVEFRPARQTDAAALAELTTQLGYPSSPAEVAERLAGLDTRAGALIVAEADGRVVGWVHVRTLVLLTGPHAEIDGLVVGDMFRGLGVGEALLQRAEAWAAERGQTRIYVRSNVIR